MRRHTSLRSISPHGLGSNKSVQPRTPQGCKQGLQRVSSVGTFSRASIEKSPCPQASLIEEIAAARDELSRAGADLAHLNTLRGYSQSVGSAASVGGTISKATGTKHELPLTKTELEGLRLEMGAMKQGEFQKEKRFQEKICRLQESMIVQLNAAIDELSRTRAELESLAMKTRVNHITQPWPGVNRKQTSELERLLREMKQREQKAGSSFHDKICRLQEVMIGEMISAKIELSRTRFELERQTRELPHEASRVVKSQRKASGVLMSPLSKGAHDASLDAEIVERGRSAEQQSPFEVGIYDIVSAALVKETVETDSIPIGEVLPKNLVRVLEIKDFEDRIRARIEEPPGWISILNKTSGVKFAERCKEERIIDVVQIEHRASVQEVSTAVIDTVDEHVPVRPAADARGLRWLDGCNIPDSYWRPPSPQKHSRILDGHRVSEGSGQAATFKCVVPQAVH